MSSAAPAATSRNAAWRLAQAHNDAARDVAKRHGRQWRGLSTEGPRTWMEAIKRAREGHEQPDSPASLEAAVEACEHVLRILAAEADERARLDVDDPLRFLRTPTSDGVWKRAIAVADENEAREQVRAGEKPQYRRGGQRGGSRPPASADAHTRDREAIERGEDPLFAGLDQRGAG
ncbi:hypothetical protein [Haliangium sp.]|uniref:hypothetical protein n=1 Tax=Haliangium sp. TaxID=2663208 RepID=UPI003D11DEAD